MDPVKVPADAPEDYSKLAKSLTNEDLTIPELADYLVYDLDKDATGWDLIEKKIRAEALASLLAIRSTAKAYLILRLAEKVSMGERATLWEAWRGTGLKRSIGGGTDRWVVGGQPPGVIRLSSKVIRVEGSPINGEAVAQVKREIHLVDEARSVEGTRSLTLLESLQPLKLGLDDDEMMRLITLILTNEGFLSRGTFDCARSRFINIIHPGKPYKGTLQRLEGAGFIVEVKKGGGKEMKDGKEISLATKWGAGERLKEALASTTTNYFYPGKSYVGIDTAIVKEVQKDFRHFYYEFKRMRRYAEEKIKEKALKSGITEEKIQSLLKLANLDSIKDR